jgi:hypothetical protein
MREPVETDRDGFRSRRSGRGSRGPGREEAAKAEPVFPRPIRAREPAIERITRPVEVEPPLSVYEEDSVEEIGRPEGPLDERHIDPFGIGAAVEPELAGESPEFVDEPWTEGDPAPAWEPQEESAPDRFEGGPGAESQGEEAAEEAPGPEVTPLQGGPAAEPGYGRRRARGARRR